MFGYNIFVITTGSMEPEIKVGDVIVSRVFDGGEINEGDVVTYVGSSGEVAGKLITHEVISISGEGNGRILTTKGVANSVADPPVSVRDVRAVFVYKTVLVGPIYRVISNVWGFIFLVALPMVAMIAGEVVNLVKEWKNQKEEQGDEQSGHEQTL